MIPEVSSEAVRSAWRFPMAAIHLPLVDYEPGGVELEETGLLDAVVWTAEYRDGAVYLSHDDVEPVRYLELPPIECLSLAFDASNRPHLAYVSSGRGYWRYWDALSGAYATMDLGMMLTVRAASDVYKFHAQDMRDVWVCYVKNQRLTTRIQRDRFTIEYARGPTLSTTSRILQLGRNVGLRMQWRTSK